MAHLFRTDSIVLCYANVEAAKRWWVEAFDCKAVPVPEDWDNRCLSDVALKLPGDDEPSVLLSNRAEAEQAGFESQATVPILFCDKLQKAHAYLVSRGVPAGPIQDGRDTEYFEVRDSEGNVIEICQEP